MTGLCDPDPARPERRGQSADRLDLLARAAVAQRLSRRQLAKLGAGAAVAALIPEWAIPAGARARGFGKTTGPCPPQPKKPCADGMVRIDYTPDCKIPVAKGNASEFNGCGPLAGVDAGPLGHGDWVPDRPFELANFFDACKAHDCCYGKCGSQKSDCDDAFGTATMEACVTGQGLAVTTLFGGLNVATCLSVARLYHSKVADDPRGQAAFDAGQAEVCDCCTTYTVQFDSGVTITASGADNWSGSFQYEYTAQVTLSTPADGSVYASGSAPGSYSQASGTMTAQSDEGPAVWTLNSGAGGVLNVVDFEPGNGSPTITLVLSAPPLENYTLTAPQAPTENFPGPFWMDVFMLEENINVNNGQITLSLQPGPGLTAPYTGVVAQGEFHHSSDIGTLNGGPPVDFTATEHTIITVTAE